MDIKLADPKSNVETMRDYLRQTTDAGTEITIFPECTLSGYCFESFEEAFEVSESISDGPSIKAMMLACRELETHAIFGFLERDGERIFNTAICTGPSGLVASYRKVHLPTLGVDNFTTPGEGASIFELKLKGQDLSLIHI